MGELYEAYSYIDRNMVVDGNFDMLPTTGFSSARVEAAVKAYLAGRDNLAVGARELNENFEIEMKLVPRKQSLSAEGLEVLDKLEKVGALIEPQLEAKRR